MTVTEVSMNTPYANRVASAETPVLRPGQAYRIGSVNTPGVSGGPVGPDAGDGPEGGGDIGPSVPVSGGEGPPPAPTPAPTPRHTPQRETGPLRLASTVISSKTIDKPAPPYPAIARAAGVQGPVAVQILVDEQGRVISAKATSGNPLLQPAAVQAAYRARFTPTLLGDRAVKVTGSITYNFVIR
jgi:protein TonB